MRIAFLSILAILALAPILAIGILGHDSLGAGQAAALRSSIEKMPGLLGNTVVIVGVSGLFAWSLAVPSAVCLVAMPECLGVRNTLRFLVDFGSAVPRLLWGVAGATLFGVGLGLGFSVACGVLTLTCLLAPLICTTLVDGLDLQQSRLGDTCRALAMTRWQAARYCLLPAISQSQRTAVRLALSRGLGDAAALYLTAGTVAQFMTSPAYPGATISVHILTSALETPGGHTAAMLHALLLLALTSLVQWLLGRLKTKGIK